MMQFEKMTVSHIDEIVPMYIEAFNAPPWKDCWTEETVKRRLHQMIQVEDFYGLCAYKNGELCGMILGCMEQYYDGMVFHAREFCTRNSLRGQGLGTNLLQELERHLRELGVKEIMLTTARGHQTEHFYKKQGFSHSHELIIMKKDLK